MNTKTVYRIILDLCIITTVIQGWWFFALPLALIGVWTFPFFIEIMCVGILYDALFNFGPEMGMWAYSGTVASVCIFIVVYFVKKVARK